MKKIKWFGLILMFVMLFSVVIPSPMHAAAIEDTRTWYYPVTLGDEAWSKLKSAEEAAEICNMPEDLLPKCSTAELADLLLDYPQLSNIDLYDNPEWGFDYFKQVSNIFREFFSRNDSTDTLLEKYDDLQVDYMMLSDPSAIENHLVWKDSQFEKELFLQIYFGTYLDSLSEEQKLKLKNILGEKFEQQKGIYEDYSLTLRIFGVIKAKTGQIPLDVIPNNIYNVFIETTESENNLDDGFTKRDTDGDGIPDESNVALDGVYNVYFWAGYYTQGLIPSDAMEHDYGDYYTPSVRDQACDTANPYLTRTDTATYRFNCHAYAWIMRSYNCDWWLTSPADFALAKYHVGTNCAAQTGDYIIIKSQGVLKHSVYVTSGGGNAWTINTKAKLGDAGVYTGLLCDAMYTYSGDSWEVYR